jgi:hypothetical protein
MIARKSRLGSFGHLDVSRHELDILAVDTVRAATSATVATNDRRAARVMGIFCQFRIGGSLLISVGEPA